MEKWLSEKRMQRVVHIFIGYKLSKWGKKNEAQEKRFKMLTVVISSNILEKEYAFHHNKTLSLPSEIYEIQSFPRNVCYFISITRESH